MQELKLEYGTGVTESDVLDSTEPIDYWNLVKLNLHTGGMDLNSLRYVLRRVNRVRNLRLNIRMVRSDAYSDKEAEELFNEIKNCTAKMDNFEVKYIYDEGVGYLSQDKASFTKKT